MPSFKFPKRSTFKTWLNSLDPYKPLGEQVPCEGHACPIERYYVAKTGRKKVNVGRDRTFTSVGNDRRENPEWMRKFINAVDVAAVKKSGSFSHSGWEQLSPAEILFVLSSTGDN